MAECKYCDTCMMNELSSIEDQSFYVVKKHKNLYLVCSKKHESASNEVMALMSLSLFQNSNLPMRKKLYADPKCKHAKAYLVLGDIPWKYRVKIKLKMKKWI